MARASASKSDAPDESPGAAPRGRDADGYTVVARRYRPQRFEDVVGQDHVVQALRNAITLHRVTHAYLFSGTRGVGKTSIARIFAKCLNCVHGPTVTPCNECDICRAISVGQDVDVIEIDGASNNGVEQVRELRQNAGLRPSRARYKIYYIDEVHMLSTGAFNALLKTLEEPPEHVKFFFATTEPTKIPITVLSRCQRFDFAGILPDQITATLAEICAREGIEADAEALQVVARRAGGSMRDAQSLLEQLLSFGGQRLTSELVHRALGLAPDDRVLELLDALAERDPARALTLLDAAIGAGVQPADVLAELLDFLRDVMVLATGADPSILRSAPGQRDRLRAVAGRWPLDTILAALQILAEARGRLRGSPHGRLLVEMAMCRVARLEDLVELGELIARLDGQPTAGAPAGAPLKKKPLAPEPGPVAAPAAVPGPAPEPAPVVAAPVTVAAPPARVPPPPPFDVEPASTPAPVARGLVATPPAPVPTPTPARAPVGRDEPSPTPPPGRPAPGGRTLGLDDLRQIWGELFTGQASPLSHVSRLAPTAMPEPGVLVVRVPPMYNWVADACDKPEARARLEELLNGALQRPLKLHFDRSQPDDDPGDEVAPPRAVVIRPDELESDPLVQDIVKLFEARPVRVEAEEAGEA